MLNGLRYFAYPTTCARPWTVDDCQTADLRSTLDLLMLLMIGCLLLGILRSTLITCAIAMAPVKCYFHDCSNTSENKSLFTFPINDEPRLELWIKHSANANLASLTHRELKNRFICEDHFEAADVIKHVSRNRLVPTVVPFMYKPVTSQCEVLSPETLKVKTPQKFYQRKCIDLPLPMQEDPSPSTSWKDAPTHTKRILKCRRLFEDNDDEPEVKRLRKQVTLLKKKSKEQQAKIRRLSLKGASQKKKMIFLESLSFSSEASKTMASMQLRKSKSRGKWSKREKELCLSIYYKSPATYIHMRRQGIVLAAPSTIRKWLGQTNCLPGLQKDVFLNVEKCFKNATIQDRSCVLAFDEMYIMTSLEYSKKYDQNEGFEDFGRGERVPKIAKYVLVFLIRGIYCGWKLPVAYFLSAGNVTANKLTFLIKIVINKLFDIGLLPKAIVSDQISTNQSVLKSLVVLPETPYFFCNGRKIFAFFDVPHALKNIRNNFLASDLTDGEKVFCFGDVIKTYDIDKKNKSKCLNKLTPAHLKPNNFQKMKVSLAAQVLSRSVAVAIRTVVGTGELKSSTALDTANFIETVNNAFDALNSRKRKSKNPFNCALTKNLNRTRQALNEGRKLLLKLKKIFKKKNGSTIITRPPSFDGFLQSIEAVMQMFEEEASSGVKFLLTSRLNQDVLENLFAIFRLKAGFNKNPSARVLRTIFRSKIVNALMKTSEKKNCLEDDDIFIENTEFKATDPKTDETFDANERNSSLTTTDAEMPACTSKPATQTSTKKMSSNITLEECSVVYFAGYLAKKCIDLHQCEKCKQSLIKDNSELNDKNQLLILNKLYPSSYAPKLFAPSEELLCLVDASLTIFKEHFESMKHTVNLRAKMYKCIKDNYSLESTICTDHEKYIIDHFLLVKIHDYCKSYKKKHIRKQNQSQIENIKKIITLYFVSILSFPHIYRQSIRARLAKNERAWYGKSKKLNNFYQRT